jgi:TRAP-type C4-dicarboxylate transport system permease small subunit
MRVSLDCKHKPPKVRGEQLPRILGFVETIASFALLGLMTLVCSSIISRWLFNLPFSDWFDFSRLLLGIAVFWGIAAACARDDHIRGDVIWSHLPLRLQHWVDAFGRVLILIFVAALIWKLFEKTADVRATAQETAELRLKIWPFYGLAWLSTLLAGLVLVLQLWLGIHRFREQTMTAAPQDETVQ